MVARGDYEPKDSRKVTGTVGNPDKSWREQEDAKDEEGEYAPRDQRNVTGQPTDVKERWHNEQGDPPKAGGEPSDGARKAVSPEPPRE